MSTTDIEPLPAQCDAASRAAAGYLEALELVEAAEQAGGRFMIAPVQRPFAGWEDCRLDDVPCPPRDVPPSICSLLREGARAIAERAGLKLERSQRKIFPGMTVEQFEAIRQEQAARESRILQKPFFPIWSFGWSGLGNGGIFLPMRTPTQTFLDELRGKDLLLQRLGIKPFEPPPPWQKQSGGEGGSASSACAAEDAKGPDRSPIRHRAQLPNFRRQHLNGK